MLTALQKLVMSSEALGEVWAIVGLFNMTDILADGYQIEPTCFSRPTPMMLSGKRSSLPLSLLVGCLLGVTASADEPIFVRNAELKIEAENGSGGEGPAWHPQLGLLSSGNGDIYQLNRQCNSRFYRKGAGTNEAAENVD